MGETTRKQRILKIYGLGESDLTDLMKDIASAGENITLEILPRIPEIHVKISLGNMVDCNGANILDHVEGEIRDKAGQYIFAMDDHTMEDAAGGLMREKALTVSVAESCTGGRIGNLLTNVPGSSDYFLGGIIVYSNQSKMDLLNVAERTIRDHGAVSDETVREMAEGVRGRFHAGLGLAVTGIAGPGGGDNEKPVGTVHLGLASGEGTVSQRYRFPGTREQVRQHSALMALDWLRRYGNGDPFIPGI